MNHCNPHPSRFNSRRRAACGLAFALALAVHAPGALAGETIFFGNGATLDWSLTTTYGMGVRLEKPSGTLLADRNADDGNRNFDRGSLTSNQMSALGEMIYRNGSYGAVVRASTFYDHVYHQRNDHDSPATANKSGEHNRFTGDTKYYSGGRSRFLDAYVYGAWNVAAGQRLSVKAGRHVESWGESTFYPGVSGAQTPADAVKSALPGVETKEVFLPLGQVSARWSLSPRFSLGGYIQYEWKGTELPPVGSYLSTSDVVGPGREFVAFDLLGNPRQIRYLRTAEPRNRGQWGAQMRFRPNSDLELSLFHVRYHDKNPAGITQQLAAEDISGLLGFPPGTVVQQIPQTYIINYYEDIKLTGISASTRIGDTQVSGEWSWRDGAPTNVLIAPGTTTHTRGKGQQMQASFVHTLGDRPWASQTSLVGEIVHVRLNKAEAVNGSTTSVWETAGGRQTRSATAYTLAITMSYPGVFSGWDLTVPVNFSHVVDGYTPFAGAIGGGQGDRRFSVGTTFKRLGNLEIALRYNAFLGSPAPSRRRMLTDRDYLTFAAKYSF